jgi:quinohemoprotein ethanol dehydrogenase
VDRAKGADACCDVVNRGVAYWEGKVYVGTLDGRLVALDANTGEQVWSVATFDPALKYTITGAPRVIKGQVMIGNGGAEYGVRGYVSAYDADTGELTWRFYTVPGNPADGFENDIMAAAANTWNGSWWNLGGGGTVWDAIAYDADAGPDVHRRGQRLALEPGPAQPRRRRQPVPQLHRGLDPDDGSYKWHYQTTPGETWDFTATQPIMIADLTIEGAQRRVVMQAPKNGFFYVLDAATGEFISAENFINVNWATHIDLDTGRPVENPDARYNETGVPLIVQPSALGGHNWHPMSFSQRTNLVYLAARENIMGYSGETEFITSERGWNTGTDFAAGAALISAAAPQQRRRGSPTCWPGTR